MNKKECRQQARSRLASLSDADVRGRGESFAQALEQRPEYRQAGTVFCYLSVGREPDTFDFLRMALQDGKRVCAPVCIGKGVMRARQLSNLDKLEEGQYGIPVPPEGENWVEPEEIDFAVIPCVACGEDGTRLGHGAGFYDRFLQKGRFFRAALCHEELLFPHVPTEEHDEKMDLICTQSRVLTFGKGRDGE